ncbi:MAG: hypothetical protein ONB48_15070 [candidate division KSB1 bacterium]|nr:hypothetical protein [candidate division KSB1 bacterium]MDZ7273441.1 hypothetical protein [candidate division KSB1 bacterium]MDZ7286967.1 hypothetical protein [candidate division KSB1 bacterium]MDZ7299680.1 hypothetical protein [candidate division KSB1 bacterium]MDZ7307944.1 hypothetical protein [candidate division KSB1 bacterium]
MKITHHILGAAAAALTLSACTALPPTASAPATLALQLEFRRGTLHPGESAGGWMKPPAVQPINRIEIYVLFAADTLAHATARVAPGDSIFSAVLEVTPGEERRLVVEAWSDQAEVESLLEYRGVQAGVRITAGVEQQVTVTLYPVPVAGRRVVMIAGRGAGAAGSSRNQVPIYLISADTLRGLQLDLHAHIRGNSESFGLQPRGLVKDGTLPLQNLDSNLITSAGSPALRVVLFDDSGRSLPPLLEPRHLFDVDFQVEAGVPPGTRYRVWLSDFVVRDSNNRGLEVLSVEGEFLVR